MPAAFTGTPASSEGNTAALTYSLTVPSGATGLLVRTSSYQAQPSSVTYNGVALSLEITGGPTAGNDNCAIYTMPSPPAGTADVVVNFAAAREVVSQAAAIAGGNPLDVAGTGASGVVTGSPTSRDVTCEAGGFAVDVVGMFNPGTMTAGANQTQDYAENNLGTQESGFGSSESGTGTVTMSWSWTDTGRAASHAALPINPSAAGAGAANWRYPTAREILRKRGRGLSRY